MVVLSARSGLTAVGCFHFLIFAAEELDSSKNFSDIFTGGEKGL